MKDTKIMQKYKLRMIRALDFIFVTILIYQTGHMNPVINKVEVKTILGEAPHWDANTQTLYFVDIFGETIHKYVPATNQHCKAHVTGKGVSFIIPVEGSDDRFILSMGKEIVSVKWDGVRSSVSEIKKIAEVEKNLLDNKFNDGKADPTGKVWAGTTAKLEDGKINAITGTLYSFGKANQIKKHVSNIHTTNGMAWNAELKKYYYIDSAQGTIDQFDYDQDTESISNRQILFTLAKHNIDGTADGQAIDTNGNLWIAIFNGYKVIKIDGKNPETLLGEIKLPGKQITSVVFGGVNLDELYVTSGNYPFDGKTLLEEDNGVLYHITNIGAKGFDGVRAKIE